MLLSLFSLERETENNKLRYHYLISIVHTLSTSQRAKKSACYQVKKIVFGALLTNRR